MVVACPTPCCRKLFDQAQLMAAPWHWPGRPFPRYLAPSPVQRFAWKVSPVVDVRAIVSSRFVSFRFVSFHSIPFHSISPSSAWLADSHEQLAHAIIIPIPLPLLRSDLLVFGLPAVRRVYTLKAGNSSLDVLDCLCIGL